MDIGSMAVSKSMVHRARIAGREQASEKIVELRNQEIPERLVLHWDGKLLPSLSGDTEDRIAVLLTGKMTPSSFLGPGKLGFDWKGNVAAVVLEGGGEAGVRTRSSPSVSTPQLQTLAWCKDVFEASLCSSSGPDIGIFKRSVIDGPSWIPRRENGETSRTSLEFFATNATASKLKDDALAFLKEALMSKNLQEDYEELLVSPTCSSVVKVQPNPFPPSWSSP
ncbi:hypothetical protein GWK47_053694 [Chionoecetes opilio]|uniref:Uncharacterized protein n=1 Tax=Chionoecetes opilio TaxID=41210 RepID=A0A8J4Y0S3_CHIOP|nr:hypothetical protein GWK47_053694 [Chionoecetes opilio]